MGFAPFASTASSPTQGVGLRWHGLRNDGRGVFAPDGWRRFWRSSGPNRSRVKISRRSAEREFRTTRDKCFVPILYRDPAFDAFDDFSDFVESISCETSKTCQVRGSNPCWDRPQTAVCETARDRYTPRARLEGNSPEPTPPGSVQASTLVHLRVRRASALPAFG